MFGTISRFAPDLIAACRESVESSGSNPHQAALASVRLPERTAMNDDQGKAISQQAELAWTASSPRATTPSRKKSWMDEIDERIRQKAGNAPVGPVSGANGSSRPIGTPPPRSATTGSGTVYGSGITEEEIHTIISKFSLR